MASAADILEFFAAMEPLNLGNAPRLDSDALKIALARIWASILHDVSVEDLGAAQVAYLGSKAGRWWPTPADIRQLCPSVARAQLAESGRDWWPPLLRAIGSGGGSQSTAELHRRLSHYAGATPSEPEFSRILKALDVAGGLQGVAQSSHDADRARKGEAFGRAMERMSGPAAVISLDEQRRARIGQKGSGMARIGVKP
ncbi:MAG TPA: hypothetical protein PLA94_29090 [Myxococcota bacterium]|nr:hypothetical protein [Myxococcota bacterium]